MQKTFSNISFDPENIILESDSFTLKSAIAHYGNSKDSGHYTCIVKIDGNYYEIDNSKIKVFNVENLKKLQNIEIVFLEKKNSLSNKFKL